jgi:hypothetical protein
MLITSCFLILVNFIQQNHHYDIGWMMKHDNGETIRTWATDRQNQTHYIEITPKLPKNYVNNYTFNKCLKNGITYNVYTYSREVK